MKDKKERFHQELKELLKEYNAQLTVDFCENIIVEFDITNIEEEPIPALILGFFEDGQDI